MQLTACCSGRHQLQLVWIILKGPLQNVSTENFSLEKGLRLGEHRDLRPLYAKFFHKWCWIKYIAQLPWKPSTFLSAASKRISVGPQTTAQNGPPVVPDSFGNLRKRVDARYSWRWSQVWKTATFFRWKSTSRYSSVKFKMNANEWWRHDD